MIDGGNRPGSSLKGAAMVLHGMKKITSFEKLIRCIISRNEQNNSMDL